MNRIICWRPVLIAAALSLLISTGAAAEHTTDATTSSPATELRSGGVLDESFAYHRQPPSAQATAPLTSAREGGWYGYGFPVKTYRWGWFGVNYYPTVHWYHGYYGDCCRRTYRCGY
jgi:hypothetical protein